jgi:sugar O-acyltransferase (sialic acid O-acetyltransferase NeuD family)
MNRPDIIIIGAGGHAHACIDVIEQQGEFQIAGLVGMQHELRDQHLGYSVIATDDDLFELTKTFQYAFIAVGQIQSPVNRIRIFQKVTNLGFILPSIISPKAYVSQYARIGNGTVVMHYAFVNADSSVGDNCIINTRAIIEHDADVKNHCHISTGAILNGNVNVGEGSFVGSGSIIKEGVTIGQSCVVGMGVSVRHNLLDSSRFIGT